MNLLLISKVFQLIIEVGIPALEVKKMIDQRTAEGQTEEQISKALDDLIEDSILGLQNEIDNTD